MANTLVVGDHVLVNKFIYRPSVLSASWQALLPMRPIRRGDVVVFRFPPDPSRDFVKRCVGLPGDTVEIVDMRLRINGHLVDEGGYVLHVEESAGQSPWSAPAARSPTRDPFGPLTVPPGQFFCLGDNRDNSHDSRSWGAVPSSHIIGRAWLVYWSADRPHAKAKRDTIRAMVASLIQSLTAVRLGRCLRLVH
jgi:signal peptidase I